MMEFIDRTKITEEPSRVLVHRKPRIAPVIDADQDQRDQLTTRLSLRRDK